MFSNVSLENFQSHCILFCFYAVSSPWLVRLIRVARWTESNKVFNLYSFGSPDQVNFRKSSFRFPRSDAKSRGTDTRTRKGESKLCFPTKSAECRFWTELGQSNIRPNVVPETKQTDHSALVFVFVMRWLPFSHLTLKFKLLEACLWFLCVFQPHALLRNVWTDLKVFKAL